MTIVQPLGDRLLRSLLEVIAQYSPFDVETLRSGFEMGGKSIDKLVSGAALATIEGCQLNYAISKIIANDERTNMTAEDAYDLASKMIEAIVDAAQQGFSDDRSRSLFLQRVEHGFKIRVRDGKIVDAIITRAEKEISRTWRKHE